MSISLRCFFTPLSSSSSFSSNYRSRAAPLRITRSAASLQESLPSQINPPPETLIDDDRRRGPNWSGIQVPRRKYISISKSELLHAIISAMFPDDEEARQFLSLSQLLDSVLHAEHKTILEEMRSDFDLTLDHLNLKEEESGVFVNGSLKCDDMDDQHEDSKIKFPFGFTLDMNLILDFPWNNAKRNPIKNFRVAIPERFQRVFMKLLNNAEFEELSPRDLMLTSALNTDYLLTLPVYVDWKRASESSVIIFRSFTLPT